MIRVLLVDIGAGTMDVLYFDTASDLHYKAVVKSPVRRIVETAEKLPGNLLVTGGEMGGGPISSLLIQRARHSEVVMSVSAAATLNHDLEKVRSWGITIVEDHLAEEWPEKETCSRLRLSDLENKRLQEIVEGFGVPFSFDAVGICVQDHGVPPEGVSHLDYRHNLFKDRLDKDPSPAALIYSADEVPATMNRLVSLAKDASLLPAEEVFVMDSGMAAILGAAMDIQCRKKEKLIILDIATSHTVGATLVRDEIAGFFEYHTIDIDLAHLESLLESLADGTISHEEILVEGGHGAYCRKSFGFKSTELILATGPKRKLIEGSRLPIAFGSPLGDNMMPGTVGLLEAIRRRKGLRPISYL